MGKPGRPRIDDDSPTARVMVRMSHAQRLTLRRVANETGNNGVAGLIREAVNEYVADYGERPPFRRRP